jgi:CP4-57 regulatory protein AlpA
MPARGAEPPPLLVNFAWLQRQGIVANRMDLFRKRKEQAFPPAIELSRNRVAWRWAEVEQWLAARPRRVPGGEKVAGAAETAT